MPDDPSPDARRSPPTCPACAEPVSISSSDEGTQSYEPARRAGPGEAACAVCGGPAAGDARREAEIRKRVEALQQARNTTNAVWADPAAGEVYTAARGEVELYAPEDLRFLLAQLDEERAARQAAEAEVARLQEALAFYADPANYDTPL